MKQNAQLTKVIWSFSSQVLDKNLADNIVNEEVDALRLVYHRDHGDKIPAFVDQFREKAAQLKISPTAILLDLSEGARATLHGLSEPMDVPFGDTLTLSPIGGKGRLQANVKYWDGLFKDNAQVFVGFGNVVLRVKSLAADLATLEVIQGGTIFPDMDIHIPETRREPSLKELDSALLEKMLVKNIEYIVLPGVWDVEQLEQFRALVKKAAKGPPPWLILRVDSKQVYERLDGLLPVVDGVMISRREMALTVNPAMIPIFTKEITQKANDYARLVLTASEMLGSMRRSSTPTRAEVSDIANAITDGTDALVLSEEVTQGPHGVQAVKVMRRIIQDTEKRHDEDLNWVKLSPAISNEMDAIAYNAYTTAERVRAKALVCITMAGNTALKLASFRAPVPIIAVTFGKDTLSKLSLVRGVQGVVLDLDPKIDDVLPVVSDRLLRDSWLKSGDKIVFVSITLSSVGRQDSNLFTLQNLA